MSKRRYRDPPKHPRPDYPTLERFDTGRREFLARLGGALLGAGALAGLAACGEGRAVGAGPEQGAVMGEPPLPDAQVDFGPEELHPGGAPPMPSRQDLGPDWGMDGEPRQPDARVDDGSLWAGGKPGPDSRLDGGCPNP